MYFIAKQPLIKACCWYWLVPGPKEISRTEHECTTTPPPPAIKALASQLCEIFTQEIFSQSVSRIKVKMDLPQKSKKQNQSFLCHANKKYVTADLLCLPYSADCLVYLLHIRVTIERKNQL